MLFKYSFSVLLTIVIGINPITVYATSVRSPYESVEAELGDGVNRRFNYSGNSVRIKPEVDLLSVSDILDELNAQRLSSVVDLTTVLENQVELKDLPTTSSDTGQSGTYFDASMPNPALNSGDEAAVNQEILRQMQVLNVSVGEKKNAITKLSAYDDIIAKFVAAANSKYTNKLSVALVKCLIMQESSGNPNSVPRSGSNAEGGYGLMQIEFGKAGGKPIHEKTFAEWVQTNCGQPVTDVRREVLDPYKNLGYGIDRLASVLDTYPGDYAKSLQGYNYGSGALNRLLAKYPDTWFENRKETVWLLKNPNPYGTGKYGDMNYVEHVMRYFAP